MELITLLKKYNTQKQCVSYLEDIRWQGIPICPYCSSTRSTRRKDYLRHKCHACNRSFSVLVGTILESTKLPLSKWFAAMILMLNAKKGISSLQLSRDIGVNKNTGWYIQKRVRKAMDEEDEILTGIIEADETYVGGSLRNMHQENIEIKKFHRDGMEHMTPVLGMVQRGGRIVVKVLEKAWGEEIKPIMKKTIDQQSELVTDGFGGYSRLGEYFKKHIVLNYTKKIRKIDHYHTNTIDGFWGILKRAVVGQYHQISVLHLQDYVNEISFKYNHRDNSNMFNSLLINCLKRKHASL